MAQIFHPATNTIAKATIFGALILIAIFAWVCAQVYRSPYFTLVHVARDQPVPFSHEHHVSGLGIDCRFCHTSVKDSAFAGLPPTKTCMTCHSQIWTNAELLEPVRASYATLQPLRWTRVHDLPDFAFFNHSIHIAKGVGCSSCHGEVNQMPLMWKTQSLQMEWCVECHREPEQYLRPREEVFNMQWTAPSNQLEVGRVLLQRYHVNKEQLNNCSICHR
jgi:hypothetical protein